MKKTNTNNFLAGALIFFMIGFGASSAYFVINDSRELRGQEPARPLTAPMPVVVQSAPLPLAPAASAAEEPLLPPDSTASDTSLPAQPSSSTESDADTLPTQLKQKAARPEGRAPTPPQSPVSGAVRNVASAFRPIPKPLPAPEVKVHSTAIATKSTVEGAAVAVPASAPASAVKHAKADTSPDAPKPVIAEPLVKTPFKPSLVTANSTKVWVKVDERKTLVFERGEAVPGFGIFKEFDGKNVKFDTGSYSLTSPTN